MVWDGVRCVRVARLETPHEGNIFSVVWLPGTEDGLLASGAGDCRVCLVDLEAADQMTDLSLRIRAQSRRFTWAILTRM